MKTARLALALLVAMSIGAPMPSSAREGTTDLRARQVRADLIVDITQSWRRRILAEGEQAGNPGAWARRLEGRLARLSDQQLRNAERAESLAELELLFLEAPIPAGTTLSSVLASLPGNVTWLGSQAAAKANPSANPALYADLAFTVVTPCRIYDSRFGSAAPLGPWAMNSTRPLRIGPHDDYSPFGGQATPCLGATSAGNNRIAAVLAAVSTVNQTGAGYLVFSAYGSSNAYGVAQYFQPGYVQTSFVLVPTDMAGVEPLMAQGYIANAGANVIVDVVGYFQKTRARMWASVWSSGTLYVGHRVVSTAKTLPTGQYEVIFDRPVASCAYVGTPGSGTPGALSIGAHPSNADGIIVETTDLSGTAKDLGFHVEVSC